MASSRLTKTLTTRAVTGQLTLGDLRAFVELAEEGSDSLRVAVVANRGDQRDPGDTSISVTLEDVTK